MKLRKNEIEAAQDIEAHEIYKSLGQTQKFDDKRKTSEDAEKNFTYVSNSLRFSSPELASYSFYCNTEIHFRSSSIF